MQPAFRLGYLPALDGLRGLAVLGVVGLHYQVPALRFGYLGVTAFFVLSGFLITSLLLQEWHSSGAIQLRHFLARRALRLLPALTLLLISYALFILIFIPPHEALLHWWRILVTFLYANNYFQTGVGMGALDHGWSLGVEEQFYLVWPSLLLLVLLWRWPTARITAGVALLLLASIVERVGLTASGMEPLAVNTRLDTRADALLMGSFAAITMHWAGLNATRAGHMRLLLILFLSSALVELLFTFPVLAIPNYIATLQVSFLPPLALSWLRLSFVIPQPC